MPSLKNVLLINAASSGLTGLILALLSGLVAGVFETDNRLPFVGVGLFLIAFSFLVLLAGFQNPLRERMVALIVWLDVTWVIVSLGIVALRPLAISTIGYVLIALVAGWVMLMAYLQYNGIRQLSTGRHQKN